MSRIDDPHTRKMHTSIAQGLGKLYFRWSNYKYFDYDAKIDEVPFEYKGNRYLGFHKTLGPALSQQLPVYVQSALSLGMVMQDHPNSAVSDSARERSTPNQRAATVFRDGLDYYNLKRLKKGQKDYVRAWMYDAIKAHARNPHEAAMLIMETFAGQRSSYGQMHALRHDPSATPFEPNIGAFNRAHNQIQMCAAMLKVLGAFPKEASENVAIRVMEEAGCDVSDFRKQRHMIQVLRMVTDIDMLREWMDDVDSVFQKHGVTGETIDMGDAMDRSAEIIDDIQRQRSPHFRRVRTRRNDIANVNNFLHSLETNAVLFEESQDMELFVQDTLKHLTSRLKGRG